MIHQVKRFFQNTAYPFFAQHPIVVTAAISTIGVLGGLYLFQRSSAARTSLEGTQPQTMEPQAPIVQQHFASNTCVLAQINGEDSTEIPLGMDIKLGQNSYHVRNLVMALLSMDSLKDPLTNSPLTEEEIERLADRLGMTPAAFKEIWGNVSERSIESVQERLARLRPNLSPTLNLADVANVVRQRERLQLQYLSHTSDHHTDERFKNLLNILTNQTAFTSKAFLLKRRAAFLELLEQNEIWVNKFGRRTPPQHS